MRPTPETDGVFMAIAVGDFVDHHKDALPMVKDHCEKLERQRDEARESLTKACEDEHRMAQELALVTAERDKAREQARYGWERHAEKDAAYGKALAQRDEVREKLETEKEAREAFAAAHRKCSDDKSALEKQLARLLEAINLALHTNGGPIDGADTADGEAYVMVRSCAFAGLKAAIAEVEGGQ